ncbi:hypothetical protein TIFTF001_023421 [Ficus carica]|uniref:Uncharacterized protein n=1 Tax=Ficus carica TaxID=3494 RepID=A0AA88DG84_FICCA|nr:hypothetical protein TIFTF001_023421 [Ficus carica]
MSSPPTSHGDLWSPFYCFTTSQPAPLHVGSPARALLHPLSNYASEHVIPAINH